MVNGKRTHTKRIRSAYDGVRSGDGSVVSKKPCSSSCGVHVAARKTGQTALKRLNSKELIKGSTRVQAEDVRGSRLASL